MRIRNRVCIVLAAVMAVLICYARIQVVSASAISKFAYPGGFQIAMILDVDGAVIDDVGVVKTSAGNASLANKLMRGDTIIALDGKKVNSSEDIVSTVKDGNGDEILVTLLRNGKKMDVSITPYIEHDSGLFRLGVYLRDTISGIGTVTYVKENGYFAALGHSIVDLVAGNVPISGGKVYSCEILGVIKGKKGEAGEIRACVKEQIGEIYSNSSVGVFGRFYNYSPSAEIVPIGNRADVVPGKAYLISSISGQPVAYELDIIRAIAQNERSEKGIFIRVTDRRLIEKSGGIVQGMSGSPIILNGKLVGAVTHVLVNDPTKGYGIYIDWMQSA